MLLPALCAECGRPLVDGEEVLCMHCRSRIPVSSTPGGTAAALMDRIVPLGVPGLRVAVWTVYARDSMVARLIRKGKYEGRPDVIRYLAGEFAAYLAATHSLDGIDVLQPVPMNLWRRLRRGYNQAEIIARAIAGAASLPVADALTARRHNPQARGDARRREAQVQGVFSARGRLQADGTVFHPDITGRNVALVDDIITTGSTAAEALAALAAARPASLSFFALASPPR